ncbi:hypothetical protein BCU66_011225 [Vibrio sp. 10N.286.49.B1]|uniref:hypothetical protein n=1 Tax=unclassified Vibrio TaxID=2614977 RepID=UPI0013000D7B|nr:MULTISPECIES: hypothetical protein [unclassified Vibrio]
MDDLQFYVTHDYCPNCNAVTTHDIFEFQDNTRDGKIDNELKLEQTCERCQASR